MTATTRRVVNVKPASAPTARPSDVLLYRRCEAAYAAADLDRRTTAVETPDGVVVADAPVETAATTAVAVAAARPAPPAHVAERIRALRFRMAAEASARGSSIAWMDPVGRR